jgi:hypothetical protein
MSSVAPGGPRDAPLTPAERKAAAAAAAAASAPESSETPPDIASMAVFDMTPVVVDPVKP